MSRSYPDKSRNWCWTGQLQDGESWSDKDATLKVLLLQERVLFAVYNHEVAPETGQRHIQGCLKLSGPRSFDWVREHVLTAGQHIEKVRNWIASCKYCSKPETQAPGTEPVIVGDVRFLGIFVVWLRWLHAAPFWGGAIFAHIR